jgi:hypothetical protein
MWRLYVIPCQREFRFRIAMRARECSRATFGLARRFSIIPSACAIFRFGNVLKLSRSVHSFPFINSIRMIDNL